MNRQPLAELYIGSVWHKRWRPTEHAFRYPVFYVMLDLDVFDSDSAELPFGLSVDRMNICSVHQKDYGASKAKGVKLGGSKPGTLKPGTLKQWVKTTVADAGVEQQPAKITMLTMPRILGYSFNPITVYYCYDESGDLFSVLYEVHNTFGEAHTYLCPVSSSTGQIPLHQTEKVFHVSPFFPVSGRYLFRQKRDDRKLSLTIRYEEGGSKAMTASLSTRRTPLTSAKLMSLLARIPFVTLKVTAAIHYEALRLWLKRVTFFAKPAPPLASVTTGEMVDKPTNSKA